MANICKKRVIFDVSPVFRLCTQPQVLLVENEKAVAFIQNNKSSFDIIGEATSTAKIKGGRING